MDGAAGVAGLGAQGDFQAVPAVLSPDFAAAPLRRNRPGRPGSGLGLAAVIGTEASDHFPIVADLELPHPSP
ncbi:hypothetical protein [Nonomuraea sp. 10N515B]|uniref:hypothetical protein n=1 Tax=Nonomuraea sp. 10N515B TaxID=3457422 RepID=UPI003FCD8563